MLNVNSNQRLSLEELKGIAPSIFTEHRNETSTSEKYVHMPTYKVIEDMELLGWFPVAATEVRARKRVGFQKHMIIFRNDEVVIDGKDNDTVYPQIILTNSHDGKNAFNFQAGLFRLVCSNGLVVAKEMFDEFKVRHMGYDFEACQEAVQAIVKKLPLTVESMNKMKQMELDQNQIVDLAKSMLDLRVEGSENTYEETAIEEVLNVQRPEDSGNGLWEVFNRIQENIIEGNFHYNTPSGKSRQARVIKNFNQDIDLNSKLFGAAMELVA